MLNAHTQLNGRQRYNIEPMISNASVHWALLHRFARDPEYVKAVLRSYIEVKKARGRLSNDISIKLNHLEQDLPHHADAFHSVRAEFRLPPSRILPASSAIAAVNSRHSLGPPLSRVATSAIARVSSNPPPRVARRATETATRRPPITSQAPEPLPEEFRVRPDAPNENELPPPPYTRADPEPDSTRLLQERLSAEAEASATLPREPPMSARPPPPPAPALVWADPSSSNQLNRQSSRRSDPPARPISPPHPPEDDEIARAYEENQLEEAKRASIIAERERQEVEEAMRLSLDEQRRMSNAQAGPSANESEDALQRRVSSYSPVSLSNSHLSHTHRRVVSEYQTPPPNDTSGLSNGMSQLSVPGGPSLLDCDDSDGTSQPALVPQRTGAVIQSRNPFLSPGDVGASSSPGYAEGQMKPPVMDRKSSDFVPPGDAGSSRRTAVPSSGRALPAIPTNPVSCPDAGIPHHLESAAPISATMISHDSNDSPHTLSYYQTIFLIDDAPSLAGEGWERAQKAFIRITEAALKHSVEGIDVYFTNSKRVGRELMTSDDVEELLAGLQPRGNASIGYRLRSILRDHLERLSVPAIASPGRQRKEVKPVNLIVVTDGMCAQQIMSRGRDANGEARPHTELLDSAAEDDLKSVIVACARELDQAKHPPSQIGIQFLQIGGNTEAREALQELDDGIAGVHGVRDMVDLVVHDEAELSTERINKTMYGGIDRSWDEYNA